MKNKTAGLQRLNGIGRVLEQRLVEAGYDTLEKVSSAGEEGLSRITGMKPQLAATIAAQAAELAERAAKRASREVELRDKAKQIKDQLQELATCVRARLGEDEVSKAGRRVDKEFTKVFVSLERVEATLKERTKRAGKGLIKTEKRIAGLADAKIERVGRGLKKARKSLKRVFA